MNELMKNVARPQGGQRGPQKTTDQRRDLGLKVQAGRAQGKSFKQLKEILNESYGMLRGCFDQVIAEQETLKAQQQVTRLSATLGANGTSSMKPIEPNERIEIPNITSQIRLDSGPALRPEFKQTQEKSRREKLIDAAIAFPDKAELYYDMIKMLDSK